MLVSCEPGSPFAVLCSVVVPLPTVRPSLITNARAMGLHDAVLHRPRTCPVVENNAAKSPGPTEAGYSGGPVVVQRTNKLVSGVVKLAHVADRRNVVGYR